MRHTYRDHQTIERQHCSRDRDQLWTNLAQRGLIRGGQGTPGRTPTEIGT